MLYRQVGRRCVLSVSFLALTAGLSPNPVVAQDTTASSAASSASSEKAGAQKASDDFHDRRNDFSGTIVVSAIGVNQLDVLAGTSVLEGVDLQRNLAGQVGDVLAKLPGVSTTSFSPGASRPVLRGFSGERVKVLVDGIGSIDASNVSADHAVSIDPLTAERIDVLRGPAVMLYGSQAIGGAVNIIDKRIPLRPLEEPVHIDATLGGDLVSNLREGGASADIRAGNHVVVHIDGSYHKTDNLEVPGFVASAPLRAELLADAAAATDPAAAAQLRAAADIRGILPNSATETKSGNFGVAVFEGDSNMGVAFGIYDTVYGAPVRPGGAESGNVTIDLKQKRADFRGELDLGAGFFSALHTRFGYSDYSHSELDDGVVGTIINVKGFEGRAELEQAEHGTWKGSLGTQYSFRDFESLGEEAYIPANLTEQYAFFGLQEAAVGPLQLQFAGRYERSNVSALTVGFQRGYDSVSAAISLAHETDGGLRFGINGSRAQRAPSAEELLANGAHAATQSFEIGDLNLIKETAWGIEGFMRGKIGAATINVAAFRSWFRDYIYLDDTGGFQDDLPVFRYRQADVTYSGVEGEFNIPLHQNGPLKILADLRGDYIRASLSDGTPIPRIPPVSLLGALELQSDVFDVRAELQYFGKQNRVGAQETPTDAFAMVNASVAWKPLRGDANLTLLLQADNIFDVEGRRAASFTKDFVPLPGRNFKISARASF